MIKRALLMLLFSTGSTANAASLTEAHEAYEANKVAEAERLYRAVASDSAASSDDRAEASVELARIAWLVDGNADLALQRLDPASATGAKACDLAEMRSRVLRESKRSEQAITEGPKLIEACPVPAKRDPIRVNIIAARLDRAAELPAERSSLLKQAKSDEQELTEDAGLEGARVRLETALLIEDPRAALAAWKDYFWLDDNDAPQALEHVGATRLFTRGLARNATAAERLGLAELLMRAGFAEQSRRYAKTHGLPGSAASSPIWRRLSAYWRERDKLETELLRVHREFAQGRKDDSALETAAKAMTAGLMTAAGARGDPREAMLKYYGLVGTVGETNGYPSIHLGHVVEDRSDEVRQYGHAPKIRFRSIDNMISNGFTSWLWDGSAAVGGWTADGIIVQVRPAYASGPLSAYRLTQAGPERARVIGRQRERAAEDVAKLKARPVATLEGLNDRLQLQYVDQILATARSRAASEADVRRLFLAEITRATFNQSILVHEGRHAVDETLGLSSKVDQSVLEGRAKLSELALTAYPRMALRNMDRSLEGDGPHDRGAARIFDGFRKWMEAHPSEIMGYDPAVPALEQLDKLTDSQIAEIARAMDPLAQGRVTAD
jgi:hypothetical protein